MRARSVRRALTLVHRWLGGVLGLVLAVLGLTGVLLLHKSWWVRVPGRPVSEGADVGDALTRVMSGPDTPRSIVFASADIPFHRLSFGEGTGGYVDATGQLVARWTSVWNRPELWLFDLHRHLLSGETGEILAGVAAIAGLVFVVTGLILWWPTRSTFRLTAMPRRLTRSAIVRHHRDLGAVAAPLLLLSFITGTLLVFEPVRTLALSAWSGPAAMEAAAQPPHASGAALVPNLPWSTMMTSAARRFPDAEPRVLSLPKAAGQPIALRLRATHEWLPNGRTTVWFRPDTGAVLATRGEETLPTGSRVGNLIYPLHAASVGGWIYTLAMTLTGLALTLLGGLAVWSFWKAGVGR